MIIGLVGLIGSGKGTAADMLITKGYKPYSFASSLKDACAAIFGWPRELLEGDTNESRRFRETPDAFWSQALNVPNFTPRFALQYIGTNILREKFHNDIWINSMKRRIQLSSDSNIVISDVRFPNELELIRGMGGYIVRVQRGSLPDWYGVAAQANLGNVEALKEMQSFDVHSSEWSLAGYEPDHAIYNDSTLTNLEKQIDNFLNFLDSLDAVEKLIKES